MVRWQGGDTIVLPIQYGHTELLAVLPLCGRIMRGKHMRHMAPGSLGRLP